MTTEAPIIVLKSHWTDLRWGRLHARVRRRLISGPRIILVHGLIISSRYMVPTMEHLAPWGDIYAIDLPGYGLSDEPGYTLPLPELADAIDEWMKANGLATAHLVANSFGCQVSAEFAVRYPQRVDRLVFQGPTVDRKARSFPKQLGRIIRNSRRESPQLGGIMRSDYARAGLTRIIRTIRMALNDRLEDKLPRISAPTLVVRGEHDPIVPQEWAEEVCCLLPRGQLAVIPGTTHTINYTAPNEFVSVMKPFLELDQAQ